MKLTKKEVQKIADNYNLGKVKSSKVIPGGWVNYNYLLKTEKGDFVLRVIGSKINNMKKTRLASEFKLLNHLDKKGFPYKIPVPIKNKKGAYLTKILKSSVWIYKKIEGKSIKNYDNKTLGDIAKALATYHKYVKGVKIKNKRKLGDLRKLAKKYSDLKKITPKNDKDRIMLQNIDLFIQSFEKLQGIDFKINELPIHYDFHKNNILFKNKKVAGIIDFERIFYAPRILDIAHLIKCSYKSGKRVFMKRVRFILKEYNKVNPLTKKEEDLILPMLLRDNLIMFEKFCAAKGTMKTGHEGAIGCLNWTIDVHKNIMRELK